MTSLSEAYVINATACDSLNEFKVQPYFIVEF
jgi:hypothetical protein